jgi:UDP-N-acetylglucosamine acyltransferase
MPTIHPSAIVSPSAELADDVHIGPYCIIEGRVKIGAGSRLLSHVNLFGPVTIGAGATIYPNAAIGFPPQDVKFKLGAPTAGVVIGKNAIIREHATIHAATSQEVPTTAGDDAFIMVNAHLGHDARIGNNVILVNNVSLAGHTQVFDRVVFGGSAVLHQFDRVGRLAMVAGGAVLTTDIPPFCLAHSRNLIIGLNLVGLRRSGVPREHITLLREAYRDTFRRGLPKAECIAILRERAAACPLAGEMAEFLESAKRPIAHHPQNSESSDSDSEVSV